MRLESNYHQKSEKLMQKQTSFCGVGIFGTPFGLWNIDKAIFL
ncbi:MAG: hypothetical protein SFU27_11765 [Thermonemataceae bacterium]|nr:hypothetical protein [Thermonemataceae bacterium]